MEIFKSYLRLASRTENNKLYVEFEPENIELKDCTYHGMAIPISGTIQETIEGYRPKATSEMFIQVEKKFPGIYTLA